MNLTQPQAAAGIAARFEIKIQLPDNRDLLGRLNLTDSISGQPLLGPNPVPCLGRSDNLYATSYNNPTRNPLLKGGDTPTGLYLCRIERFSSSSAIDESTRHSYGPYGKIHLDPISGDALLSSRPPASRSGICIHSGDLNPTQAYAHWLGLRPTHGCIRLFDTDMLRLLQILPDGQTTTCTIISLSDLLTKTSGG